MAVHRARLVDMRVGQSVVVFGSGTVGLVVGSFCESVWGEEGDDGWLRSWSGSWSLRGSLWDVCA